jgi:hypothetical protein
MKILYIISIILISSFSYAQVDTTYIYNGSMPYGSLDIRIAKSATRFYYLQENVTFSFRESAPGVKTNTFKDMTSWNSSSYTEGNLREKNGNADAFILNYRLLFPVSYKPTYSPGYPIIIMMHGAGERGNCWDAKCYHDDRSWSPASNNPPAPTDPNSELLNNDHNLMNGGAVHLDARNLAGSKLPNDPTLATRAFPGFVLFPQNLNGWTVSTVQDAIRLVRLVVKKYNIDEDRIYIHGLSNGGSATYEALKRAPWLFSAALPMSAVSEASLISQGQVPNIAHIPLWVFQGGKDTGPSPGRTHGYVKAFRDAGAEVRYTEYPNLGHGTWNTAYKEPDFFLWMLNKNKANIHTFSGGTAICLTNGQGVRMELAKGFYKYQWQRNGVTISGATGATYVANTTGTYRARFSRVPNPTEAQWNQWSDNVTVTQQNPAQAEVEQIGTVLLKDLNNFADARLKAVGEFAHYYWYRNGALVDLAGTQDDTIQYAVIKQGNCTSACTGNGSYTLVTAGLDNCPSPPSVAKHIYFYNQAPLNITAPSNFTGSILSPSSVRLGWKDASTNETGFEVWSRKKTGSAYTKWELRVLTAANVTGYSDTRLEPSTTYQYKIRAVSNSGRSNYTPLSATQFLTVTTTADTTTPTVPSNLVATSTAIKTITLKWNSSSDNTGIRQYRIYYGSNTVLTGSSKTTYELDNLNLNTTYSFTVRAEDFGGNLSPVSNAATADTYVTGLYYEHSTGAWGDIDDINWANAEFTGAVTNFTLAPRTQEDYFNFKFDGYLYITKGGTYQFRTTSDDGSRVELDSVIVVNNDGVHESKTVTGPLQTLTAGPKRIVVKFFEYAATQTLSVKWKGPDSGNLWAVIPNSALRSGTDPSARMMIADTTNVSAMSASDSAEVNTFDIAIYPNPASGRDINVQLASENNSVVYIKLVDYTGRSVYENTFDADQLKAGAQFIPENIGDGIYILLINQDKKSLQKRVIIKQ